MPRRGGRAAAGAALLALCAGVVGAAAAPRDVVINGREFVSSATGKATVLIGANVVMKGPPWIPAVAGDLPCGGNLNPNENTSCQTFNVHDATHLTKDLGYNFVRLGVTWAGGQPTADPVLDKDFVARLHAFLDLCHDHGIAVVLDVHQDAVGTAVCGEGVPQWFSALATPGEIGKPLTLSGLPLPDGTCGPKDTASWEQYKGDVEYNVKNPCCRQLNQGSWSKLSGSAQARKTMSYLFTNKDGRAYYAKYMGLLAAAVKDYPAAVGIELINEPPYSSRGAMYQTYEACYAAVRAEAPDLVVGVVDPGTSVTASNRGLSKDTVAWLTQAAAENGLFYAFHCYGRGDGASAVRTAKNNPWGMPSLLTEYGGYGTPGVWGYGCDTQKAAKDQGVGSAYWHYSDYCWPKHCPDGKPDGHCPLPEGERWGACITGWGNGNSSFYCGITA